MTNRMTSERSPEGRRIIAGLVTGPHGERIQAWRERNDPQQARRLPPHITLCYWAPVIDADRLERQVRHAFPGPLPLWLGSVKVGDNEQRTLLVEVLHSERLDEARARLYDGRIVALPPLDHWRWHVTCVRDTRGRDLDALLVEAQELAIEAPWTLDTIAYMELRGEVYQEVARWRL
jgi:hypothetical protein